MREGCEGDADGGERRVRVGWGGVRQGTGEEEPVSLRAVLEKKAMNWRPNCSIWLNGWRQMTLTRFHFCPDAEPESLSLLKLTVLVLFRLARESDTVISVDCGRRVIKLSVLASPTATSTKAEPQLTVCMYACMCV